MAAPQQAPSWSPQDSPAPAEGAAPPTPLAMPAPGRPKGQDHATLALLAVAALIAVGGVGFALGHATAPGAAANAAPSGRGGFGARGFASLAPGQTFAPGGFGVGAPPPRSAGRSCRSTARR